MVRKGNVIPKKGVEFWLSVKESRVQDRRE